MVWQLKVMAKDEPGKVRRHVGVAQKLATGCTSQDYRLEKLLLKAVDGVGAGSRRGDEVFDEALEFMTGERFGHTSECCASVPTY